MPLMPCVALWAFYAVKIANISLLSLYFVRLKFCKHAMIRSARKTPGEVRPGFHHRSMAEDQDTKPAQRYIQHLCNIPAICNRSAQTISTRPDSPRNRSPKISRTVEIRKTDIKNCEIVKFPTKIREKIFRWLWEYCGNRGAFKSCQGKI